VGNKKLELSAHLEPAIDGGVYINLAAAALLAGSLLLLLPLDVLLVVRQRDIEVERLVALVETEPDEGVLPPTVLDAEHEVAGGVEHGLDGALPLAGQHEACGEELTRGRVLEPDLAAVAAGHHAEAAGPDLVRLQPLAALVAAAGGARRDLVHRHLAHHQQRVLEGLLLLHQRRHDPALASSSPLNSLLPRFVRSKNS